MKYQYLENSNMPSTSEIKFSVYYAYQKIEYYWPIFCSACAKIIVLLF